MFQKRRRNLGLDQQIEETHFATENDDNALVKDPQLKKMLPEWLKHKFDMSMFTALAEGVLSNDYYQQHYGLIGIRKLHVCPLSTSYQYA